MPELPEVEILVRHLQPQLAGRRILRFQARTPRVVRPDTPAPLARALRNTSIESLSRRAKYLLLHLNSPRTPIVLVHLGMTGRLYLAPTKHPEPSHLAARFDLDRDESLLFVDPRRFGRISAQTAALDSLGLEPWAPDLTAQRFHRALASSKQPIKPRLLDQHLLAGIGNIYACEALFHARIHPARPAHSLSLPECKRLLSSIRRILQTAIATGTRATLHFGPGQPTDNLFYFGSAPNPRHPTREQFRVYDRADQPCARCKRPIQRITQAGRSTFLCPVCQQRTPPRRAQPGVARALVRR